MSLGLGAYTDSYYFETPGVPVHDYLWKYVEVGSGVFIFCDLRGPFMCLIMTSGDMIDCTRMGVGGKAIPPYIDKISDIR